MITRRVRASKRGALVLSASAVTLLIAIGNISPARALDEHSGEAKAIDACEKALCTMLLTKNPIGGDLKCQLTKTWQQSTIKEAESTAVKWGYGDARCSVDLNVTRAAIVSAMTAEKFTYEVPAHTAHCVVEENKEVSNVTVKLAPKIVFKNGKAEQVWVNLKSVEAPAAIELTVKTAAYLADTLGLFHKRMIKSINRYLERHCPEALAEAAKEKDKAKGKTKAKAAAK
jgi:hypothetical protein